ncbi:hypothetical protein [Massilia sp. DD77]|uniref:hypothetical protein n=1 Tax=Massilia sp. DD77 TaxID=3109349 RepID=UPI002FFEC5EA
MKRPLSAALLAAGLWFSAVPPALAQTQAEHRQQIEQIVETFRKAIIDKDKDSFMKLFLREDITWSAVFTDASVDRFHARSKAAGRPRPPKLFSSNPRSFIEDIAKDPKRLEETFSNVRIDTDGEIAHVWFDYAFMEDKYKQNWGKEGWQLLRTDAGWKIAAVVWSMEANPEPPPASKAGG